MSFKKKPLQTAQQEENAFFAPAKYDLYNPDHRAIILEFEKEIDMWFERNPGACFEKYLEEKGAIRNSRPYVAESGVTRYGDFSVIYYETAGKKIVPFNDLWRKWSAYNELRRMRDQAKQRERESLDVLAQQMTM